MKYISTRRCMDDNNSANDDSIHKQQGSYSFEDAICTGYAPDGGLFVPVSLPITITSDLLNEWKHLTYVELMQCILRFFIDVKEISDMELHTTCRNALNGFDPQNAVPVIPLVLSSSPSSSVYVAELFHGPTFCFKDFGMRILINLLSFFATKRNRTITLLVSTTGDTGPAAVQAVSDIPKNAFLKILVHYPHGQISNFQRKQLTTCQSTAVHIVSFQGGGDDMDKPIKNMLQSSSYFEHTNDNNNTTSNTAIANDTTTNNDKNSTGDGNINTNHPSSSLWTGVNSYNIGRPLTQMVHFIWTYLRIIEQNTDTLQMGDQIDIMLPTGAMGNIVGGYMAKCMGLPIHQLIAAVNTNDITNRVIQTGLFHRSDTMYKTLSDAINIQVPYNFERLLFYLTNQDHQLVSDWMNSLERTNKFDLNQQWLHKLQNDFDSYRVTDDEMCETIRTIQNKYSYLCDPHTAVAFHAAIKLGHLKINDNEVAQASSNAVATAILATASPCKFEESMTIAVGETKWNEYCDSDMYPAAAKRILSMVEREPTVYEADTANDTLEETQVKWEAMARSILLNQLK